MRRCLVLVLVAVLCLRAWAGEAMAGQMLAHELAAAQTVEAMAGHGPDCPGAEAQEAAPADHTECRSCLSCQDCSLHAMTVAFAAATPPLPDAATRAVSTFFASIDPRPGFKPPIA